MIRAFKSYVPQVVLAVLFFVLPINPVSAYDGLLAPAKKTENQKSAPEKKSPGYGGLIGGEVKTAPRTVSTPKTDKDNKGAYYGQSPAPNTAPQTTVTHATTPLPEQSFPDGLAIPDQLVTDGESLKILAIVEQSKQALKNDMSQIKIPEKTLLALNAPKAKIDGHWAEEIATIEYINQMFDDLNVLPADQKKLRSKDLTKQFETMIDVAESQIAAPDEISYQLGLSKQTVADTKEIARARIEHLKAAVNALR